MLRHHQDRALLEAQNARCPDTVYYFIQIDANVNILYWTKSKHFVMLYFVLNRRRYRG